MTIKCNHPARPVDALEFVVLDQPGTPEGIEYPGIGPFPKPSVCRTARTDAAGV